MTYSDFWYNHPAMPNEINENQKGDTEIKFTIYHQYFKGILAGFSCMHSYFQGWQWWKYLGFF